MLPFSIVIIHLFICVTALLPYLYVKTAIYSNQFLFYQVGYYYTKKKTELSPFLVLYSVLFVVNLGRL